MGKKLMRQASAVALAAVSLSAGVPLMARADATPPLTCNAAYEELTEQAECIAASAMLDTLMATALPAERALLEAQLLQGITINGLTLRCVLGVTCDTVPTALAALTARYGDGFGDMPGSPDLRDAMYAALSAPAQLRAADSVSETITRVVSSDPAARLDTLRAAVDDLLASLRECPDCPGAEETARTAIVLVALAWAIPPSVPTASGVETRGVGMAYRPGSLLPGTTDGLPTDALDCVVTWEDGLWLNTKKEAYETTFLIRSGFTVHGMRWTDPVNMHGRCPVPSLSWFGAYQVTAESNAGGINSKTKNGPFVSRAGELTMPHYGFVVGPTQEWRADGIAVEWDFPWGAEVHFFGEPFGNYWWRGAGQQSLDTGYLFPNGRNQRTVQGRCDRKGGSEEYCIATSDDS